MSLVAVMMWQPIASAWKMLSSSRGLAQISSMFGVGAQHLDGRGHQRHRIAAGVGDAPGEHRDAGRRAAGQRRAHVAHLVERQQRRDVQLDARLASARWMQRHDDSPRVFVTGIFT